MFDLLIEALNVFELLWVMKMYISKASYSSEKVKLKFSSFILLEKCMHGFLQAQHYVCNMGCLKHCCIRHEIVSLLGNWQSQKLVTAGVPQVPVLFVLHCVVYTKIVMSFILIFVNINIHKPWVTYLPYGDSRPPHRAPHRFPALSTRWR